MYLDDVHPSCLQRINGAMPSFLSIPIQDYATRRRVSHYTIGDPPNFLHRPAVPKKKYWFVVPAILDYFHN
jgi:hypothetical protein